MVAEEGLVGADAALQNGAVGCRLVDGVVVHGRRGGKSGDLFER